MRKITLLRNISNESSEACMLLEKANINFREVFSEDDYLPTLIVPDYIYPFRGIESIKNFIARKE